MQVLCIAHASNRCSQEYDAVGSSTEASSLISRDKMLLHSFSPAVFSRYVYANVCPGTLLSAGVLGVLCYPLLLFTFHTLWYFAGEGASRFIHVPVEPLIGHMRHPYALCANAEGVPEQVSV